MVCASNNIWPNLLRTILCWGCQRVSHAAKCLPQWGYLLQHDRGSYLCLRQRLDWRWLQWEHWWLCHSRLLQWCDLPWPCSILLLRVPGWKNWCVLFELSLLPFSSNCYLAIKLLTSVMCIVYTLSPQVCFAILMMHVSVTPATRARCVIPTLSMVVLFAPVQLAL